MIAYWESSRCIRVKLPCWVGTCKAQAVITHNENGQATFRLLSTRHSFTMIIDYCQTSSTDEWSLFIVDRAINSVAIAKHLMKQFRLVINAE